MVQMVPDVRPEFLQLIRQRVPEDLHSHPAGGARQIAILGRVIRIRHDSGHRVAADFRGVELVAAGSTARDDTAARGVPHAVDDTSVSQTVVPRIMVESWRCRGHRYSGMSGVL